MATRSYDPNISPPFGEINEFWKRYDELADRSDREMVANLNVNLDVLLIFAGLFSAVNTAFISAAMSALVPDPLDKTNALLELLVLRADNNTLVAVDASPFSPPRSSVIANCLLYASLCCSLVAAVGAMLAKEWLQNYSRTGQAGPLEEQGRFRQRKYSAAQDGHLQSMVLFLPNLLLLSVLLFFGGLIIFLFPINMAVVAVVIAFFGVGVALSGTTIVAGAISPLCPYQTSISRAIRRAVGYSFWYWKEFPELVGRVIKLPMVVQAGSRVVAAGRKLKTKLWWFPSLTQAQDASPMVVEQVPRPSSPSAAELGLTMDDNINGGNHAAIRHHLLAAPSRLITQRIVTPTRICAQKFLRVSTHQTDDSAEHIGTKKQEQQTINARAVCWLLEMTSSLKDQLTAAKNICLIDPMACDDLLQHPVIWPRLLDLTVQAIRTWTNHQTDGNRLVAEQFGLTLYHLLLLCPIDHEKREQIRLLLPQEMFQPTKIGGQSLADLGHVLCGYKMPDSPMSTVLSDYRMWKATLHRQILDSGANLGWSILEGKRSFSAPFDDATLSLVGLLVLLRFGTTVTPWSHTQDKKKLQDLAHQAYTGATLDRNIAQALPILFQVMFSPHEHPVQRSNAAGICTAFIWRVKLLADRNELPTVLQGALYVFLPQLLIGFQSLEAHPGDPIELAVETVRTIRSLQNVMQEPRFDKEIWARIWIPLEYSIEVLNLGQQIRDRMVKDFLLDFFRWTNNLGQAVIIVPPGPGRTPRLIKYILSGLEDELTSNQMIWMIAISRNLRCWFKERAGGLWMELGFAKQMVSFLQHATERAILSKSVYIMTSLSRISRVWSRKFLEDGVIDALPIALDRIDKERGRVLQLEILKLFLLLWDSSKETPDINWGADSVLIALGRLIPVPFPTRRFSRQSERLRALIDYLRERRTESGFVACQLDVAVNRAYGFRYTWNRVLFQDVKPSTLCSRPVFVHDDLP